MAFRYLPPKLRFNDAKITFYDQKMFFLTENYTSLHITAIFNKKKKNFHISNFSCPLVWKMTAATPIGKPILLKFCHNVAER